MTQSNAVGKIGWLDLTVEDAVAVKDFYCQVVGWSSAPVPVDDYEDFCVLRQTDGEPEAVGGICHKRGKNASLPSQWLMYVTVADLEQSMESCRSLGGKVVSGPRDLGSYGTMCVIEDPAGAVLALLQSPSESTDSE